MNEKETKPAGKTFDGGVSEEQVAQWRHRHGKVIRIDVTDDKDLHVGYFKRPGVDTLRAVTKVAKTDEIAAAETLAKNCWLGGSEAMLTDGVLFTETQQQLAKMLQSCHGSLKNL